MSTNTTNMNLPVPTVGVESGPAWANEINNCMTIIDAHNHSSGSGVPITTSGININSDLPLNANNLTLARTVRLYNNQSQPSAGTDLGCLYRFGVDLYFNDGSGNQIRMTQSGGIAGSPGTITGLVAPASATYSGSTFVWQSAANTPANMDAASYVFRNLVANSKGLTLAPPNAMASDYTLVLPALPASSTPLWVNSTGTITASNVFESSIDIYNGTIAASVGSSALTVSLKDQAGNNPSASSPVSIPFRNATSATGTFTIVQVTGALSVVVSSGSTLGHVNAVNQYIYVYAINNSGTAELAVSTTLFDEGSTLSTTAEGGAGAADSASAIYSTTARSNVPIRLIGRLLVNEATAGTWASAPSEISLPPFIAPIETNEVYVDTPNGHGSTNTTVRRFTNLRTALCNAITFADSATLGSTFTINRAGWYTINYSDQNGGTTLIAGITVNGSALTTSMTTITYAQGKRAVMTITVTGVCNCSTTLFLNAGDIVRAQDNGTSDLADTNGIFHITKLSGRG